MKKAVLANARVLVNDCFVDNHAVVVESGYVTAVAPLERLKGENCVTDLTGMFLVPGFIDIQINGGGGLLFEPDSTVDDISKIAHAHRRAGTTGFLATLISADLDGIQRFMATVHKAMEMGVPGLLGVHLEGPFLNEKRDGIHDASRFRRLTGADVAQLSLLKRGVTLVTLAPELCEPSLISILSERGFIIAAGHSDATYEEMKEALARGVSGVTHLFNAMSPLAAREPGVVGAALEDNNCWCSLIIDGHHVHPSVLKLATAMKPANKLILISDAMPTVGTELSSFWLHGRKIEVVDGACRGPSGTLAGACLDMATAVRNAGETLGVPLERAALYAASNPANFLGIGTTVGRIAPGYRADLVAMDADLQVQRTWIKGEEAPTHGQPATA